MHLPQRMHWGSATRLSSSPAKHRKALVPLKIGISSENCATPIIGPPISSLFGASLKPPHASISFSTCVPMRTSRFFGSATAEPDTVTIRRMTGIPVVKRRYTAPAVSTLNTAQPASAGSLPEGTSRPVQALMSCFSAPCGYLHLRGYSFRRGSSAISFSIPGKVSDLFSSIAMIAVCTPIMSASIFRPPMTSSGRSSSRRWSLVMYGSHSAALMMTVSHLPIPDWILTWVGKVAPP